MTSRTEVVELLTRKWAKKLPHRSKTTSWKFTGDRTAVSFEYEAHPADGQWWSIHANDNLGFDGLAFIHCRFATINGQPIGKAARKSRWEQ